MARARRSPSYYARCLLALFTPDEDHDLRITGARLLADTLLAYVPVRTALKP